jgi:hypothetical protein
MTKKNDGACGPGDEQVCNEDVPSLRGIVRMIERPASYESVRREQGHRSRPKDPGKAIPPVRYESAYQSYERNGGRHCTDQPA